MGDTQQLSYVHSFVDALLESLRADDDVFITGEDVGAYGGVWQTYAGLHAEFGDERLVDTPISEAAIVGLGVGAAATGLRPVVDLMFVDFLAVCLDQVVNQAAKMKYMFGGKARLPLTIVTWSGAGLNAAAQHSQSLEAWLCHTPGLKVVMPSNPADMKGLTMAAIADDNPVVVLGTKTLFGMTGDVPEGAHQVPLGSAQIVRPGDAVTIVALGAMVGVALDAAETLAAEGIEAEVIDPRTLEPFDTDTVLASVARTHRLVVVHEAVTSSGFGAEIASRVTEQGFDDLDAPVERVGAPFAPVPFAPSLEQQYVPDPERVVAACRRTLAREGA